MRTISVRLPVRNLQVSKAFFAELGFTFSPELSGEETACMLVDQNIYVMLVAEDRFRDAVDGETRRTTTAAGFVTGLSAGSAREVDETVAKAIAAGGKPWPITPAAPADRSTRRASHHQSPGPDQRSGVLLLGRFGIDGSRELITGDS